MYVCRFGLEPLMAELNVKQEPVVATIYEEELPVITRRRGCTLRVQITTVVEPDFEVRLFLCDFIDFLMFLLYISTFRYFSSFFVVNRVVVYLNFPLCWVSYQSI